MQKILSIMVSVFIGLVAHAQLPDSKNEVPNCLPVSGDVLYASTTEVTNHLYRQFIESKRDSFGDLIYSRLLPDTSAWRNKLAYNEPYVEYYFRHPAYNQYPVVNVSKLQAMEFCEWLEECLNKIYAENKDLSIAKVDVRLPTIEEWEMAARGGNSDATFPWEGTSMRRTDNKFEGMFRANFVRGTGDYMGVAGSLNDAADVTAPAKSYWPNAFGLYNMSGNVAEMVQEEGRTKGGGWASRAPYLEINSPDPHEGFKGGSPEIGFRYFVEVLDTRETKKELKKKNKRKELSAKMIEKWLTFVAEDSVLFSTTEVPNYLYNYFLEENPGKGFEPNSSQWEGEIAYGRQMKHDYSSHYRYEEHPVVNITKDQAIAFCQWLEERYNGFSKRKLGTLKIDLPTEEEWKYAARGGLRNAPYPWGGPYLRNSKGCWLANFNPVEERWILDTDSSFLRDGITKKQIRAAADLDGTLLTAKVDSYLQNEFGLFHMAGNVAEFIRDNDVVKGGSWGSMQQFLQISESEEVEGSSPYVGFRIIAYMKK